VAVHRPLFPWQCAIRRGGNFDGGRGRRIGSCHDDYGQLSRRCLSAFMRLAAPRPRSTFVDR
jgi:hypothetical protein